jgi:predicted aspartyl protease/tetratricopeptide (TPR) repeat protein
MAGIKSLRVLLLILKSPLITSVLFFGRSKSLGSDVRERGPVMRKILFAVLAAFFISTEANAGCEVGQLLEFKVTMQGAQPLADIGVNGRTLPFIIDSGAFFSTISPGTAQELGLQLQYSPVRVEGLGGAAGSTYLTRVQTLDLAGNPLHNIQFVVAGSEIGAAGLIGQNILGIGDVEYDLGHGAIRLMRATGCSRNDDLAYWAGQEPESSLPIDPRDEMHPHTIGTIYVNGVRVRAMFDTGAATSLLSLEAARRIGLKPSSPGVIPIGQVRGLGRSTVQAWLVPIEGVAIGTEQIRNIKLMMADLEMPDADMLIGADFFLSHRVYVSNRLGKMFFTYNGGPVFNIKPGAVIDQAGTPQTIAADASPDPTDAAGFSRRGAAETSRQDYKAAIADLDRAVTMDPSNGRYFLERARAQFLNGNRSAAFADLDQAVKIAPADPEIRLSRAMLLLEQKHKDEALDDLKAADAALSPQADERFTLATGFERADQFDKAIANYDLWIKAHPDDSKQPLAMNGRCWARALAGRDLPLALKDCDAALHRDKSASYFDSRGMVELRMGEYDRAIADYDQALALAPKMPWSLYGRGLAKHHMNDASAQSDLDAAIAMDPQLPSRAKELGIH